MIWKPLTLAVRITYRNQPTRGERFPYHL